MLHDARMVLKWMESVKEPSGEQFERAKFKLKVAVFPQNK
jgi:hypothetical protein